MENVSFIDLESVAVELEKAVNALMCFDEFCTNEGMIISKTDEEEKTICWALRARLPQFESILVFAIDAIQSEKKKIEHYSEILRLSKRGVAQ